MILITIVLPRKYYLDQLTIGLTDRLTMRLPASHLYWSHSFNPGMTELGYAILSEEHKPADMVAFVSEAEHRGIDYAMVSDHYHPWTTAQGESPFVWGVLGAMSQATESIRIGTAVTAPIIRIHPAIIAQAAATAASLLPDRFILGLGTGENLNEHVIGARWPPHDVRLDMLEQAIEIIRLLWEGGTKTYRSEHYTVENTRVFTLPETSPPIVVAAGGERAAAAAGHYGDGLMATAPNPDVIDRFNKASSNGGSSFYGQIHVCNNTDEIEALEIAYEQWPNTALPGELGQELAKPAHFEQAAEMVEPADVAERVICGSNTDEYIQSIDEFLDAGYDHVHLHQIGSEQEQFLEFYANEIIPSF